MKKLLFIPILLLTVSCSTKTNMEVDNDPLNLFNENSPVMVEGGTDSDPLDLLTNEEENAMVANREFFFEQKLACSEKVDDAKNFVTNELNYQFEGGYQEGFFEEIFYSPVEDSCLFAATAYVHIPNRDVMVGYHLIDALTTETITFQVGCDDVPNSCDQTAQEAYDLFQNDINSYKE